MVGQAAQGAGGLTRWPLGFDAVDADAPGGVPLATPVAASGVAGPRILAVPG